jgi:glucose/mannose transport system substrate-binding protein
MKKFAVVAAMATAFLGSTAYATDLEVTHWWTSGGEAAAVAELAKAFDARATTGSTAPSPAVVVRPVPS